MKLGVPVAEIVRALERAAGNTDTDPRWLAASCLRRMSDWEQRTLMCADAFDRVVGQRDRAEKERDRLRHALEQSVRLQSHYAGLLNQYDGGQRLQFATADEW